MAEKKISSRVTLRPFRLSDADDMWSYLTANHREMTRYTSVPWKEGMFKSKQDVESYIQKFCIPQRYCRSICIDDIDRSVGMVLITPGVGSTSSGSSSSWRRGDIGVLVSREHWSKGVCTRAV